MVFIKKVFLMCCLSILLFIVMPINCNTKIDQSLKRFPRQVNANNEQQIGANDTHSLENFGTSIRSGFDAPNGKSVMHDKSSGPVILPGRNNERRGRQLNIYSPQGSATYSYQDYASQPWYLANKDYYDNYYANYYQSYYQTSTESIRQSNQQSSAHQTNTGTPISSSQLNQQSSTNSRLNVDSALPSTSTGDDGENSIYIDENGLFQIGKANSLNVVSPLIDDDAIVFQSDESQYDRRTYFINDDMSRQSRMHDDAKSESKTTSFNGLPVFSN